jgi:hypothetical protein
MRLLASFVLAGCTLGAGPARGPHDPHALPSEALDHQGTAVATPKDPVIWRSEPATYKDPNEIGLGACEKMPRCAAGTPEGTIAPIALTPRVTP